MIPLDPINIDLEKTTLIEASAGTGKTYTIATLYCRLVARGYPVESILVVTFTEAAAAELTLRIRARLYATLDSLLEPPGKHEDDLVNSFADHPDRDMICKRIQLALTCFDQAAIMTIHSFCFKVLKENAFESRSLFDIELVPDRSLFLRQVSYDFFMGHVNTLDPLFLTFLAQKQVTPESFAESFRPVVSRTDLIIKPVVASFDMFFDTYRNSIKKIHKMLSECTGEIIQLFLDHKGIDKRSYTKKNVPAWLAVSLQVIETDGENTIFNMTEKGDPLYKFTRTRIELKTKSGHAPLSHEFFDACETILALHQGFEKNLVHLKLEFLSFFKTELEKMKKTHGICFFDDLVNDLADALETRDSLYLQTAVRQIYAACLIDEFQDTDPRQYDIFSKIFSQKGTPFFMIGDPKQAIYAFRGGDIFAYLKASKESDQQFTLEKNYRSAPRLVDGINEMFANRENPFVYDRIEFTRVKTPEWATDVWVEKKQLVPPVQFCFIQRPDTGLDSQGYITKETAAGIIPRAVAQDILGLLQSDIGLAPKGTPSLEVSGVSPGDIAVLVRTNLQAEQIQKALSDVKIPSFLSKSGSVFDSQHALDLHDILWAVYFPDNKGFINAALCTPVFGFSLEQIEALGQDDNRFFRWQDRFRSYKDLWKTRGFVTMIMAALHSDRAFLKQNSRLNERGLTNFYHLIELISKQSLKQQLSPYCLLQWYDTQLFETFLDQGADELRLESDKTAVAIVTIHKSKGMEYPVVVLPYLWEGGRKPPRDNILFHDPEKNHQLTLDIGSGDLSASQRCFEMEDFAEQRRLLYVALTRASAMCRIIWGGFKSVEMSALGTMLHQEDCKEDHSMTEELNQLVCLAQKSIRIDSHSHGVNSGPGATPIRSQASFLYARPLERKIRAAWKLSSFSAIVQSAQDGVFQEREGSGNEGSGNEGSGNEGSGNDDTQSATTLARFPKGAGSGDLFHLIFETLDFTKGSKDISHCVRSLFNQYGILDPELIEMGERAVKEVLETRLASKTTGFCLKDIRMDQRFSEMEFVFPIKSFQLSVVKKAFENSGAGFVANGYLNRLSRLFAPSFEGYLKGFIDLVVCHQGKWYIIDYKSNFLGDTYDQYAEDAMDDAMGEHHYYLQYHIYAVALHRYLELRLNNYEYDTHFGGVFYLFIRGMHPDFGSAYGVFFDRPSKKNISYLSDNL